MNNQPHLFAEYIKGYDKVWFMGDEFMTRSFEQYFKQQNHNEYAGYVRKYFEVANYSSSQYLSNDRNCVSRIRNAVARGINEHVLLPKYIVIVLDDDLIKYIGLKEYGV